MEGSRVEEAVRLFESGFNCAQSVFGAYADLFGMDKEAALKLTSSMGVGGRQFRSKGRCQENRDLPEGPGYER